MTAARTRIQKLYVRFSSANDIDNIVRFYRDNKSPFVFERERAVWLERATAGAVTLIEDAAGKIVASSISYPIRPQGASAERHAWTEIGSTMVALTNVGLFKTLIAAQTLKAFADDRPKKGFVMEIVRTNERSLEVFNRVGAKSFSIPPELFEIVEQTFTAEAKDRQVEWFRIDPRQLAQYRDMIRAMDRDQPVHEQKGTGDRYVIDFSRSGLLKTKAPAVRHTKPTV